ncbi:hypothetical protein ASE33_10325 [Pseudomonas sp. Root9]|jgi:hypothetical protein|nr:hypothetical protein ASE33_10325 [Pseudomonas sp. Root9]
MEGAISGVRITRRASSAATAHCANARKHSRQANRHLLTTDIFFKALYILMGDHWTGFGLEQVKLRTLDRVMPW